MMKTSRRRPRPSTPLRIFALGLAIAACGTPPESALEIGPVSYSEDQLLGLGSARRESLSELTAFALAVADSTTNELGAPLVQEWADDRRLEILAADLTMEAHGIGDDVLAARYLTDPEWELTVRHILFFSERWRSPDHRSEAEAKAERALIALHGGADFAETAAQLSEEPGAEGRQGLLTPGREGSWVPEFWAAALALQPGEMSPVTETQYGYHILRQEDRAVIPFTEARSVVARRVADQVDDPAAVVGAWMAAAGATPEERRRAALVEADERGIEIPDGEQADIERQWDDIVYRLGATLGFRHGMSASQIGDAALAALANPAQGASLARTELSGYRPLLTARYPLGDSGTPRGVQP